MTADHCEHCRFWDHDRDHSGFCRAVAPQPADRPDQVAHWPLTGARDRCGDGTAGVPGAGVVRCGGCGYWQPNPSGGLNPLDRGDERRDWWRNAGHCLRRAPLPSVDPGNRAFWAATHRDDGCAQGVPLP